MAGSAACTLGVKAGGGGVMIVGPGGVVAQGKGESHLGILIGCKVDWLLLHVGFKCVGSHILFARA